MAGPEETGADTEKSAGNDGESLMFVVVVVEEGSGVEDVCGAAGEEGESGTKDVVDSAAENAEDGEGGVESGVGIIRGGVVNLTTTTHAG